MKNRKIPFATLNEKGDVVKEEILNTADIRRCPHIIFMPEHYRKDGSCRCDDRNHTIMESWGYFWNEKREIWEA